MATATQDWPLWSNTARLVVTDADRIDEARAIADAVLADIDQAANRFRADSEIRLSGEVTGGCVTSAARLGAPPRRPRASSR